MRRNVRLSYSKLVLYADPSDNYLFGVKDGHNIQSRVHSTTRLVNKLCQIRLLLLALLDLWTEVRIRTLKMLRLRLLRLAHEEFLTPERRYFRQLS